jgi:DNA-binding NarL/FixJ family response regulator
MYIKKLRVLVADGHQAMRDGITGVLRMDFDVIGAVSDGNELVNRS